LGIAHDNQPPSGAPQEMRAVGLPVALRWIELLDTRTRRPGTVPGDWALSGSTGQALLATRFSIDRARAGFDTSSSRTWASLTPLACNAGTKVSSR
jgi:hypothetical protein